MKESNPNLTTAGSHSNIDKKQMMNSSTAAVLQTVQEFNKVPPANYQFEIEQDSSRE